MNISKLIKFTCISIFTSTTLYGISLKDSVEKALNTNPEVIAEMNNQKAFRKYIDERKSNYYPRIDIDGTLEKSNTERKYDPSSINDGTYKEDGYNLGIALNQMLYDGSLTPSRVRESINNELANKYRSKNNIEKIVLETITAYTELVQYNELLSLTKDMIFTNEKNLEIAKEKESISGEILETYQVDSKLNFVKEKYLEETNLKSLKANAFKRYVGVEVSGNECRPIIDFNKIPITLEEAVKLSVLRNNEVLEQIERIKAQREKITQVNASFLPNLNLELKALTDDDLLLDEEGTENQVFGRIKLAWNLYNGGSDYAVSEQEKLFLSEQKNRLDAITNKIVETSKANYDKFYKNKERIEILKKYVSANENIVYVYKNEFKAGTRTFVDILNAQTELYEAKKSLVNREYDLYSNYYQILFTNSMLSESILESQNQNCSTVVINGSTTSEKMNDIALMLGDENELGEVYESYDTNEDNNELNELGEVYQAYDINKEKVSKKNMSLLKTSPRSYTINLATTKGLKKANDFIFENGLDRENTYIYAFGPRMESAKVIYGSFNSIREAKEVISSFSNNLKMSKPYVDNMYKHQKLYKKYH